MDINTNGVLFTAQAAGRQMHNEQGACASHSQSAAEIDEEGVGAACNDGAAIGRVGPDTERDAPRHAAALGTTGADETDAFVRGGADDAHFAGPRMGVVQHEQVGGAADGAKHGLRTGAKEDTREHAIARAYLHDGGRVQRPGVIRPGAKWLAMELMRDNRMTAAYLDKQPHLLEKWSELNPLGRLGRPDELRGVVAWLASDASTFCTGSDILLRLRRTSTAQQNVLPLTVLLFFPPSIMLDHHRKPKDLDPSPKPTDLAERMVAMQRKKAAQNRSRDRPERTTQSPVTAARSPPSPASARKHITPTPTPQTALADADPEDFSRRLKISSSPRPSHANGHGHAKQQSKLYHPETDPIPMRRTAEPEPISDSASSSNAPRPPSKREHPPARDASGQRQLFDPSKHDPMRFARKPVPTPKSSGDYVSVSSASSYAQSISSSNFTLSSTTDGSSTSSSVFDRDRSESKTNAFSTQLKKLYRDISALETKILREDQEENTDESSRVVLRGGAEVGAEDSEKAKWKKMIDDHKQLAEMMRNLLEISLAHGVPTSLRNIPQKYNIIIRLWTHAFHRILENLRRSSFSSKIALEHLQDFIYYAYTFYTGLLEERTLEDYRAAWLEALGDLARYRMAVAAMVTAPAPLSSALTSAAVLGSAHRSTPTSTAANASGAVSTISERPAARIDDSPTPSIGIIAARNFELEPEKERWRKIAREWFGAGVTDKPGNGKLHHHLGLLSREAEGEELRGVYHFVKSMIVLHPFKTSRESVLPFWSPAAQARRALPDARTSDLFLLLHGMLFTNIQLDDFAPTLARLMERLAIEDPEEREWTMMAAINIGAILEFGKQGIMYRTGALGSIDERKGSAGAATNGTKVKLAKRANGADEGDDKKMDVDGEERRSSMENGAAGTSPRPPAAAQESPALSEASAQGTEPPPAFTLALQLTFTMLTYVLERPERSVGHFGRRSVNPYLTVVLTFLATMLKNPNALAAIERSVPWEALAHFLTKAPSVTVLADGATTLSRLAALPEDWCIRGMNWGGRQLYEQGFWKGAGERKMEMEVLDESEDNVGSEDVIIEDDDDDDAPSRDDKPKSAAARLAQEQRELREKRWQRAVWAGVRIAKVVSGFQWMDGKKRAREEMAEEERRKRGTRWGDDFMDIDEDEMEAAEDSEEQSEDDENDTEEIKALKARRRYLRSLLQSSERNVPPPQPRRTRPRPPRAAPTRPSLKLVPGYTVLVPDTNILLSSLSLLASLIESNRWTIVVPLPVIMELDGLATNHTPLGEAAKAAVDYIQAHVRSHSTSLKLQTSRGNYLSSLTFRSEQVDFDDPSAWERNMDDLILKAAIWQDEHWVDRSAFLSADGEKSRDTAGASKVVLLSLDRNLRLKARSRQLDAATEKDLASLLAAAA
ncbi:hypothetical protein EVG20_g1267 [Dentipellis fragilis]|uniref:PIN domain-containing protein n=1 Tax=Dentipellis fragilis TaxID=205917 RepID=A0A4Y9ZBA2_9AGAM|nr:hypothetical protein EVG20_g1267 [Dentipellis fragilis]